MCIHLIPRTMAEQHLAAYDPPELQRMPLGDVCLLVKSLGFADIKGFLAGVPDPPAAAAVGAAVADLQALWALDEQQQLTPLGRLLALLPGGACSLPGVRQCALSAVASIALGRCAVAGACGDSCDAGGHTYCVVCARQPVEPAVAVLHHCSLLTTL
jgi:hypothetical protein